MQEEPGGHLGSSGDWFSAPLPVRTNREIFFLKRIDTQAPPPETDSVDLQWGPGMGNFEISLVLLKFLRLRVSKRESNSQKKADDSRTIILIEQGN